SCWAAARKRKRVRPSALKRLLPPVGDRCWSRAGCGANWVWRTFLMAWRQKQTVCKRPADSLWPIGCWYWWPIVSAIRAASTHWRNGWRAILSVDVTAREFWLPGSSRVGYGEILNWLQRGFPNRASCLGANNRL